MVEFMWQFALALTAFVFSMLTYKAWDTWFTYGSQTAALRAMGVTVVTGLLWYLCYECTPKAGVL